MTSINVVYSGGVQNAEPNKSLGGFPSPIYVTDQKNNLFDDISSKETSDGVIDYRCVYIFNDDQNLNYKISTYVEYLNEVGATVQLGLLLQNAVQSVKFTTLPTGGTFTITVQGLKSGVITWHDDPNTLALRIQTAIREVSKCAVQVNAPGQHFYKITFDGVLSHKALSTLSITDNNLEPVGTIFPTIQQLIIGSPINTIAPDTGIENLAPTGITFFNALEPGIEVGTLFPTEGFPIWIKRSIAPGFEPVEGDGFILHTAGEGSSIGGTTSSSTSGDYITIGTCNVPKRLVAQITNIDSCDCVAGTYNLNWSDTEEAWIGSASTSCGSDLSLRLYVLDDIFHLTLDCGGITTIASYELGCAPFFINYGEISTDVFYIVEPTFSCCVGRVSILIQAG